LIGWLVVAYQRLNFGAAATEHVMAYRLIGFLLAILLGATIIWAFFLADFWASFRLITANPWGIVTLVDLYFGFIITSVLVLVVERGRSIAWLVILPTFFLGNVVPALWLAWRAALLIRLQGRVEDSA
jgi:hypothetical protein